jgi:hypothetical protein
LDILVPEEAGSAEPQSWWLVQGTLSFVPGVLASATEFTILEEPGAPQPDTCPPGAGAPAAGAREVPLQVTGEVPYPDGSLMFVDVSFPVTLAQVRSHRYWLASAPQGRTGSYEPEAGVELPVLTFVLREEGEPPAAPVDMTVGQMLVRVDQHPGFYYYWYLLPLGAILALLIWRKAHLR